MKKAGVKTATWIKIFSSEFMQYCEGHWSMNRDEDSYQLSHAYDRFLDVTVDRHIKIRKNWVPASSDEGLIMEPKRQGN